VGHVSLPQPCVPVGRPEGAVKRAHNRGHPVWRVPSGEGHCCAGQGAWHASQARRRSHGRERTALAKSAISAGLMREHLCLCVTPRVCCLMERTHHNASRVHVHCSQANASAAQGWHLRSPLAASAAMSAVLCIFLHQLLIRGGWLLLGTQGARSSPIPRWRHSKLRERLPWTPPVDWQWFSGGAIVEWGSWRRGKCDRADPEIADSGHRLLELSFSTHIINICILRMGG